MIRKLKVYFSKRFLPRWIVLFFDLTTICLTFVFAYLLRFNFNLNEVDKSLNLKQIFIIVPVFLLSFWLIKSYSGILRHSTTKDVMRIILSLGIGGSVLIIFSFLSRYYYPELFLVIPYTIIIIQFAISSLVIITSRLIIKTIYIEWYSSGVNTKNIIIFGAGRLGQITRNALLLDNSTKINIVGFIDDNVSLQKKSVAGIPIYPAKIAFKKVIKQHKVTELILAIDKDNLTLKRKREIIDLCLPLNLIVKEIPTVDYWLNGKLSASKIKKIKIEDILGRDAISLNTKKIKEGVKDAVVFVAGAAGSIGSEIVKQLINFNAYHVILLDKAESDLYDLQNYIIAKYDNPKFTVIVGDVTNSKKLRKIFKKYSPTIVLNAAAYKHVPLMEKFPCEAVRVNIGGTRNLANLSVEFKVEKFVLISTDKAVNPTNVMGTSKRISEIYIQALAQEKNSSTQFITTRFGNVLGSNGSVVPLFQKQINDGGPVLVTHREITRFFMTIPEACQLVLEACFIGKGGEIFIFDMGEPIKIYDLAEKMIFLSGLIPHEDIKIKITNLRPGEKLYEELLKDQEDIMPTHNDKIMIGKFMTHDYEIVNKQVNYLIDLVDNCENQMLVDQMRKIVPEFISKNSFYDNHSTQQETTPILT